MATPLVLPYYTHAQIEQLGKNNPDKPKMFLNAFSIQEIVYELVTNWFLYNDPKDSGFVFTSRYSKDSTKSDILIDISYNWKPEQGSKRPCIFIQRGDLTVKCPTMGQTINFDNTGLSAPQRLVINNLPIKVICIAQPVAVTEQIAEFVKQGLLSFQVEIQNDFKFRLFRVRNVSTPEMVKEAQDNFTISIGIDVVYDEGFIIYQDSLKLKTVGRAIFDSLTQTQFTSQ